MSQFPPLGAWARKAACNLHPWPDIFFDQDNDSRHEAKKLCDICPVFDECLEYAVDHQPVGWWANTTARDRYRIRRQRTATTPAPLPGPGIVCPGCGLLNTAVTTVGNQSECVACGARFFA